MRCLLVLSYERAKELGDEVLAKLEPYIEKGIIAGSVRRKKTQCHDVDLVIEPKRQFMILEQIKLSMNYGIFI